MRTRMKTNMMTAMSYYTAYTSHILFLALIPLYLRTTAFPLSFLSPLLKALKSSLKTSLLPAFRLGLHNPSQICFMNALMQCLARTSLIKTLQEQEQEQEQEGSMEGNIDGLDLHGDDVSSLKPSSEVSFELCAYLPLCAGCHLAKKPAPLHPTPELSLLPPPLTRSDCPSSPPSLPP